MNGAFVVRRLAVRSLRSGDRCRFATVSSGRSTIELQGEFAVSRPRPNSKGQAYIESFEGEGGLTVSLLDNAWYFSSQPTLGARLPAGSARARSTSRARRRWRGRRTATDRNGNDVRFTIEPIDPQTNIVGTGISAPETLLWLTLYPLAIGGQRDPTTGTFRWNVAEHAAGMRWRSIRTSFGAVGRGPHRRGDDRVLDADRHERGSAIDESDPGVRPGRRVGEFGGIRAGNAFGREPGQGTGNSTDSTYTGKKLQGYGRLDSERDPFSRAFNVTSTTPGCRATSWTRSSS